MLLTDQLAAIQKELRDIQTKASAEGRDFTDAEIVTINKKAAKAAELKLGIERAEKSRRDLAEITGGVATGDEHWALVDGPNGTIGFQQVDDHRPLTWPDGEVPMQLHLEFLVDDLDATGARVLAAGATRYEHQPNADHCFVYADPAGHPFCLSTWGLPRLGD